VFQTEDPELQAIIEKADGFGHLVKEMEIVPPPIEKPSGARQGAVTAARSVKEQELAEPRPQKKRVDTVEPMSKEELERFVAQKKEEQRATADIRAKQQAKARGEDAMTVIKPPGKG
jgi:hypothetical protein